MGTLKINVIRRRGAAALLPRYESDVENMLEKISPDTIYQVTVKRPRNLKHHNLFMGVLRYVVNNTEYWRTVDELLVAVKDLVGVYDWVVKVDGSGDVVKYHKSINFDSMDQTEFEESVYKPTLAALAKIIGMSETELEDAAKLKMEGITG